MLPSPPSSSSSSLPLWKDERSLLVRKNIKSSSRSSCSRESDGFLPTNGYLGLGDGSIVYKPIQSLTASCEVSSHTHGVFPSSSPGGILSLHAIREREEENLSSSSSSSSSLSSSAREKGEEETRDTDDVKERKAVSTKEVLPSQQSTTISCINHTDVGTNETEDDEEEEEEDEEKREVEKTMVGREEGYVGSGVYTPEDGSGRQSFRKRGGGGVFSSLTLDRFYRRDLQEEEKRMKDTKHVSQQPLRQKSSSPSGVHTPHGQRHKDLPSSSSTTSSTTARHTRISSSSSPSSCAEDYATYQRVKLQLLSLQYHESFDIVNTRLVDRLLQDVVKAVENFQLLMKR